MRQLLVASQIKNGWPHANACFVYVSKLTPMAFLILAFARCLAPSTSTPWRDRKSAIKVAMRSCSWPASKVTSSILLQNACLVSSSTICSSISSVHEWIAHIRFLLSCLTCSRNSSVSGEEGLADRFCISPTNYPSVFLLNPCCAVSSRNLLGVESSPVLSVTAMTASS